MKCVQKLEKTVSTWQTNQRMLVLICCAVSEQERVYSIGSEHQRDQNEVVRSRQLPVRDELLEPRLMAIDSSSRDFMSTATDPVISVLVCL